MSGVFVCDWLLSGAATADCDSPLVIHHPFTLSFKAYNLPFLQILPTTAFLFFFRTDNDRLTAFDPGQPG